MRHPDEGTLHAFVDGELAQAQAAELERHVAECAECAVALAEARGFSAAASRVVSALDSAPASVSRATAPVRAAVRARRPSYFRAPYLQAAAVLLLAAGSALVIDRSRSPSEMTVTELAREADASPPVADATEAPATQSPEQTLTRPTPVAPAARRVAVGAVGASANAKTLEGVSAMAPQSVDAAVDRKEMAAPPAPPTPALARSAQALSVSPTRATRYRLESGVVLTLVDEPLDSVEARQRAATGRRSAAPAASTMAPLSSEPAAANSYRWVDAERRRVYLLTGPVTDEVLRAAASRLGELQRLP